MPVITLLTDFGMEDEYVGIMKGVILSINPLVSIVDISHQIRPQNLTQAAFIVQAAYQYFPFGTIHIVVVDPGVGSDRDIIAIRSERQVFLAPNNGVLTLLLERENIISVTQINNSDYYLKPVSHTFHGRDIFAPVAAHLSSGVNLEQLGSSMDKGKVVRLTLPKPHIAKNGELVGKIVSVDRFGNLVTNIETDLLWGFCSVDSQGKLLVKVGKSKLIGISHSYASVVHKKPLAIIGSRGYLEIAVNGGNAETYFGTSLGDSVRLKLPK